MKEMDTRPFAGGDHRAILAWFGDAQTCACSGCSGVDLRVVAHTETWSRNGEALPTVIAKCVCGWHTTFLRFGGVGFRHPSFGASR